jgi:PHD/YefM family antitoxin component YafN of YafNO toxin-antitoxin module
MLASSLSNSNYGGIMPAIRPIADLRDKYSEISALCHQYEEPVFITKDGAGDLAVMSIETYELLSGKQELYLLLDAGLEQERQGKTRPRREVMAAIKAELNV